MDERCGETDGIEDAAASDSEDEALSIEMEVTQRENGILDNGEVIFGCGAPWNKNGWRGQFESIGMGMCVSEQVGHESGLGLMETCINEDSDPMCAIFVVSIQHLTQKRRRQRKDVFSEMDGVVECDLELILDYGLHDEGERAC